MKIFFAAFMLACSITSLANAELTFIHGSNGTTMINTIGNSSFISYPDGSMETSITIGGGASAGSWRKYR